MENNKLRVLFMEVGKEAKFIEVDNDLKSYQRLVDGWIESVGLSDEVVLLCNEEGKLRGLASNKLLYSDDGVLLDVLVGNLFVCRVDEEGDFADIKDEDLELIRKYVK
jgi:hypothetical protein